MNNKILTGLIVACLIGIAAILFFHPGKANASERVSNFDVVADVIKTDEACRAGYVGECEHFAELCSVITPADNARLSKWMRNEPPFRTRNGGSNISNRWPVAMARCRALNT